MQSLQEQHWVLELQEVQRVRRARWENRHREAIEKGMHRRPGEVLVEQVKAQSQPPAPFSSGKR